MTSIPVLERNIHQTMSWVYAIEEACDWQEESQKRAFAVLRSVLHQLRDLLPLENAIHLSAQFPLMIRGLFFENWSTHGDPPRIRRIEDFLACVEADLSPYPDIDPERATRGVFRVLRNKVSDGEIDKLIAVLPSDIKALFK